MKKIFLLLAACMLAGSCAFAQVAVLEPVDYVRLFEDMLEAYETLSEQAMARLDADAAEMGDDLALSIVSHWKKNWLAQEDPLRLHGKDDPASLPVGGRHAFVVLGYELENGGMRDELKGRCEAAAAAATAFPDSILVCSGGATGQNNPDGHTEAGLMRDYMTQTLGIAPERIFVDERAMTTAENARNTLAILKEMQIETMTIVTSAYHQLRGQTLYNAMAGRYGREQDYFVEIAGNYCYDQAVGEETLKREYLLAVYQLGQILELTEEQAGRLKDIFINRLAR